MNAPRMLPFGFLALLAMLACAQNQATADEPTLSNIPSGWTTRAPRDEIRPDFQYLPGGGPNEGGSFVLQADEREGLFGWWQTSIPVEGGKWYRFQALRKTSGLEYPRRSAVVRILWCDDQGQKVLRDDPTFASYRPGQRPRSEPEFPAEQQVHENGWSTIAGVYHAPTDATQAVIELSYRWEPTGRIEWSEVQLTTTAPPEPRIARLATVHYRPREGTLQHEKCEQFAPFIKQAAEKDADLVVLPETLTYYGSGRDYADCAEPVPGPSTEYFGRLAKQYDLYIVAGLIERDRHLVYNVAVLIGPDGEVVGKYRKVTLPRGEIEKGVTPGKDYPVFDTRFGRVGMMVCYDGFYPEVARELTKNGAEVIAWPVWGCNPLLGRARACENHAVVVSSTYTDVSSNWIISAVLDRDGKTLAQAKDWGSVAVAEVDLSRPLHWHSLGDFRAQIEAHRPVVPAEATAP